MSIPLDFDSLQQYRATKPSCVLFDIGLLGHVGFKLSNPTGTILRARFHLTVYLGERELGPPTGDPKGYYNGKILWNLLPNHGFQGNFGVPKECIDSKKQFTVQIETTIYDVEGRDYKQPPICYTFDRKAHMWFLEPTSIAELLNKGHTVPLRPRRVET